MKKVITSFTAHQTSEGMRLTYTYSVINDGGDVVKSNVRATTIVLDSNTGILDCISAINDFLHGKIPEEG